MKSRILEFIKNNPDTWEEKLNEKFICTNHNGDLVCFKYATEADLPKTIEMLMLSIIFHLS